MHSQCPAGHHQSEIPLQEFRYDHDWDIWLLIGQHSRLLTRALFVNFQFLWLVEKGACKSPHQNIRTAGNSSMRSSVEEGRPHGIAACVALTLGTVHGLNRSPHPSPSTDEDYKCWVQFQCHRCLGNSVLREPVPRQSSLRQLNQTRRSHPHRLASLSTP
jgi:hypothetical protein